MTDPERFKDNARNVILNRCVTDLDKIINQHTPETDVPINDSVWNRLDKMALELEARARATHTPRVVTSYVCPPIPTRGTDWCAYDDKTGADASVYGYGATESEAVADFWQSYSEER